MSYRRIKIIKEKLQFPKDTLRIHMILIDKGFFATHEECSELWRRYSEDHWCAGWVSMNDMADIEIFHAIKNYFEPIDYVAVDSQENL